MMFRNWAFRRDAGSGMLGRNHGHLPQKPQERMTAADTTDYPMSARLLGAEFGLSAYEMNLLLKEEGYLYGEPNAYGVTPKGESFAHEKYEKRGTGGSAQYNPSWETVSWDQSILDELDITPERVREVSEAAGQLRRDRAAAREAEDEALRRAALDDRASELRPTGGSDVLILAALVVGAGYGIYRAIKAVPRIRAWRTARAERRDKPTPPTATD